MAIKTLGEYIESLRKMSPTVFMFGKRIQNHVDHPRLRAGINATGATYELANDDRYKDMMTALSPFTGEVVNRFTLPPQSIQDLVMRVKINRTLGAYVGTCHQRCTGLDCLCTLSIVTHDIDKKYGTRYYARFLEFLKYVQNHDLRMPMQV